MKGDQEFKYGWIGLFIVIGTIALFYAAIQALYDIRDSIDDYIEKEVEVLVEDKMQALRESCNRSLRQENR